MNRLWIVPVTAALVACGTDEPNPPDAGALDPAAVEVTESWTGTGANGHTARVEAARTVEIATRTSGTLRTLPVDVGDEVRAGALLAALDDDDVRARVEAAEAQFVLAEATHGRIRRLADQGAASAQELDEATARLAAARSAAAEARAQTAYVRVHAPFDGVVVARFADPGDLAAPGRSILRLAELGAPLVVADLPSALADRVREGDVVRVRTASGRRTTARVTRVVPTLDPATRRFRVEASPESAEGLRPGEVVRLETTEGGEATRWIPEDAVVRRGQLTGVYTVEADTLRLRWLRLGRTDGDAVEVLAGPAGALVVVRNPSPDLADGRPVASATLVPASGEELP